MLSELSIDKSYLKEDGLKVLNNFSENLDLDNVIEKSKEYEKIVVERINDVNQKKYVLATISAYKWIGYKIFYKSLDKQTVNDFQNKIACARRSGIEYCLCKRLESASEGWTWVDTAQFLISGAEIMAWHLAACMLG